LGRLKILTKKEWIFTLTPSVERHFHKLYEKGNKFSFFPILKETIVFFSSPIVTEYEFSNLDGSAKIDFLFFATEHNHLDQQVPLYTDLVRRGNSVYFLDSISKLSKRIQAITENAVLPKPVKRGLALLVKLRVFILYYSIAKDISRDLSISKSACFRILLSFSTIGIQFEHLLSSFFSKVTINKGVVVGYDIPLIGRMMATIAQKYGYKVTCPMHGTLSSMYKDFGCAADNLLLFGEQDFQTLQDWNLDVKLDVTGSAALDKVILESIEPVFGSRLKVPNQKKLVLVAGSGPGDSVSLDGHLQFITALMEIAAEYQHDFYFVFKLHIKDNKSYYHKIIKSHSNVLVVSSEEANTISTNIFEWLKGVDILITGASTVGLEAQLQGIPCVSFDPKEELGSKFYIAKGDTLYCTKRDQVELLLTKFLKGEVLLEANQVKEIERKYFYKVDGKSAIRMADFLERNN